MNQVSLFPAIPQSVRERIEAAFNDPAMSACATTILAHLCTVQAAGRNSAVAISTLQESWRRMGLKGYSVRQVKAAVKELLEERNVPIGSARCEPYGYYLLCSEEDVAAALRPIWGEIYSQLRRARCLDPKSKISRELCGQLSVQLAKEAAAI